MFTIELVRDFAPIHSYGHVLPSLACAVAVPCLNIKFRTFRSLLPLASQAAMARSTLSLSMHFLGVASCGRVDGAQILMSNASHYRLVQLKSYGSVAMNTSSHVVCTVSNGLCAVGTIRLGPLSDWWRTEIKARIFLGVQG